MNRRLLFIFLLFASSDLSAQTWYVSGTGNDANDGKKPKTAFRTFQEATDLVQPDPGMGNFRLMKDSCGRNSGSADLLLTTDVVGKARPKGIGRDRGAFEQ